MGLSLRYKKRVAAMVERKKQINDPRHPAFGEVQIKCRLKSRKPFINTSQPITEMPTVQD